MFCLLFKTVLQISEGTPTEKKDHCKANSTVPPQTKLSCRRKCRQKSFLARLVDSVSVQKKRVHVFRLFDQYANEDGDHWKTN